MKPLHAAALSWSVTLLALAGLLGVLVLYTRPDFLVQMADQLWSCF